MLKKIFILLSIVLVACSLPTKSSAATSKNVTYLDNSVVIKNLGTKDYIDFYTLHSGTATCFLVRSGNGLAIDCV